MRPISSFAKSVYSQFGEDGIIEEILSRVGQATPLDRWCVEFGALDGISFSNTYNLIRNGAYHSVLIEGDRKKYRQLCTNLPDARAVKICQFVTLDGPSSLDSILKGTAIPSNFDFLSIDIDGCDYHVFDSLEAHAPKLICIEFNPTIPNEIEYVQAPDFSLKHGSSARSLVALAARKGYFLAAVTPCNLLLVREQFREQVVGEAPTSLEQLRDDAPHRNFIFFGYDGTVLSNRRDIPVPWHRLTLSPAHLQVIPRYLRNFGEDYNFLQKAAFAVFVLLKFPGDFRGLFREKVLARYFRRHPDEAIDKKAPPV